MRDRIRSLDVLRGATVALMILVNNPGTWSALYAPLAHAPWHGCTPTDLVFPFFLFAVGNALALVLPQPDFRREPSTLASVVLGRTRTMAWIDLLPGEEAGIKSVSIQIRGEYAYGYLKAEKGVHRLVRISPYDSQARRHTSFASVFVYPDIDDTIEVDLREEDIKMDVFRASGAGGQHVNKTSSAVRLTHVPTGTIVSCQQERSQTKNRATAMKMLRAAIYQKKLEAQEAARAVVEATKTDNSWGNQIRSYVFQPYTMVNDHRTETKVGDVQRVMDGDLDEFIQAYLKRFGGKAA